MGIEPDKTAGPDARVHAALAVDTIYGPVPSRRYGNTLGINLLPLDHKRCSLRCTYCQLGPEGRDTVPFPSVERFAGELRGALELLRDHGDFRGYPLHGLVLSGNGDATLHPQVAEAIDVLLHLRDELAPNVPTILLTAGTELIHPHIRSAVARLDEVAVKIDGGSQQLFERLNMPFQPILLRDIAAAAAELPNAIVQTLLVQGSVDNTVAAEVDAWLELVRLAHPRRVDLYALDRAPIEKKLRKVPGIVAEAIAQRVRDEAGIACRVFSDGLND